MCRPVTAARWFATHPGSASCSGLRSLAGATLRHPGDVAEWLRSGLQSRLHRFDSGRRLWMKALQTETFVGGADWKLRNPAVTAPQGLPKRLRGTADRHDVCRVLVGGPEARQLGRRLRIWRVVEVPLGRRDVAVAHHPLDLVDVEPADRLGAKGMAQVVESEDRQAGACGSVTEPSVQAAAADRL